MKIRFEFPVIRTVHVTNVTSGLTIDLYDAQLRALQVAILKGEIDHKVYHAMHTVDTVDEFDEVQTQQRLMPLFNEYGLPNTGNAHCQELVDCYKQSSEHTLEMIKIKRGL